MRNRYKRGSLGWTEPQHVNQATMYLDQAQEHLDQVASNARPGFCLTALEAFGDAANAVGGAAAALNAANIAPGSYGHWKEVHRQLIEARRRILHSCLRS